MRVVSILPCAVHATCRLLRHTAPDHPFFKCTSSKPPEAFSSYGDKPARRFSAESVELCFWGLGFRV